MMPSPKLEIQPHHKMTFEKLTPLYQPLIFEWLDKPHVQEFWDNSQAHRDDILNFINGRKEPSPYFEGIFDYWIGLYQEKPYCFLLTSEVTTHQSVPMPDLWRIHLPPIGKTWTIDFCIGHEDFLGKGLASPTLEQFTRFIHNTLDSEVRTFFIDPDEQNPRAIHVYAKAGFKNAGAFDVEDGFFEGEKSLLMIKKLDES